MRYVFQLAPFDGGPGCASTFGAILPFLVAWVVGCSSGDAGTPRGEPPSSTGGSGVASGTGGGGTGTTSGTGGSSIVVPPPPGGSDAATDRTSASTRAHAT